MASSGSRSRGDWVLGGRQIVGIFVLLVVMFGVVFTLGYLLGRSQYDVQFRPPASGGANTAARAAVPADKSSPVMPVAAAEKPEEPPPSEWDFFHAAEPAKPIEPMPEPGKSSGVNPPTGVEAAKLILPKTPERAPADSAATVIPPGTVLQVAAFGRQSDALALAQALQQKKFPAFVQPPGADRYYRVQVGPYSDVQSAADARKKLEGQGFKTITKR